MTEALIGSNSFFDVPFPVAIGNRYIHVRRQPNGKLAVQVFRWNPQDQTVIEEDVKQDGDSASPISVLPQGGAGGVRLIARESALEGYVTGDESGAYTILLLPDRITIMRGGAILLEMLNNSIHGSDVGIRIDSSGIGVGASLPTGFRYKYVWEDQEVTISKLVTPGRPVVARSRFVDCRIQGPAVLCAWGAVSLTDSSFDMQGATLESLIWELRPSQVPYGAVLLQDVEFHKCNFIGVALVAAPGERETLLARVKGSA